MISVIIPAHNEAAYIGSCLSSLLKSSPFLTEQPAPVQVIIAANACTDQTVSMTQGLAPAFEQKGWRLDVLDLEQGGKPGALNAADKAALYKIRAYIDADIQVSPDLLGQLVRVLDHPEARYASGSPKVPAAASRVSDRYARFWQRLPFVTRDVPGFGVYGVNAAGRARWKEFPDIISDDSFIRYHFNAQERHRVPATYLWPITEGFVNLVRVRRRQDAGLSELHRLYPELSAEMETTAPNRTEKWRLFYKDPIGFAIYTIVAIVVLLPVLRNRGGWDRGR